jgi:dUTP pyrophosphatase
MKLKVIRIDKSLPLPEYKTEGAVAFDVYSREKATIPAGATVVLPSNFIIQVPEGYFLMLASRSSTFKKGLAMVNGIGIIDQDFHGPADEFKLTIQNFTSLPVTVERGERIGQGAIIPIIKPEWEEVDKIKDESRGGFGTTGDF